MFVRARFRAGAGKLTIWGNDMKTQMRFQKILALLTLIISAITIVYSFGFFTGDLATLSKIVTTRSFLRDYTDAQQNAMINTYYTALSINDLLMWLGIIFLLVVVFIYITASQKRRNYYKTNYIAVILAAAYAAVFAIIGIAVISSVLISLNASVTPEIWQAYKEYNDTNGLNNYSHTAVMFYIGYVVFAIVLVDALAWVYNLIWKIKLMKGEKALLEAGLKKEVA
mgnify:FL=1